MRAHFVYVAVAMLTGCSSAPPHTVTSEKTVAATPGGLAAAMITLQKSPYTEACDQQLLGPTLEIAQALDAAQEELTVLLNIPAAAVAVTPLGSINVQQVPTSYATGVPGAYTEGWGDLYTKFLTLKGTPVAGQWEWARLYTRAYSLLMNDMKRLNGVNMELDHASVPLLQRIGDALQSCLSDSLCVVPIFDPASEGFVNTRNWLYYNYANAIQGEQDSLKKRRLMASFADRVEQDMQRFSFTINSRVRLEEDTLVLPLDVGELDGAQMQLQAYIEDVWKDGPEGLKPNHVRVEWVSRSETSPSIYRFTVSTTAGGRDYVSRAFAWEIHLFNLTTEKAIAHEVGHVLGFDDHYDTVWHAETCSYVSQYDDADIMSEHQSGVVTASEWQTLHELYAPLEPRTSQVWRPTDP